MWITLVRKEGNAPPTAEDPGYTIWEGGYRGEDADELPGSIVAEMSAELEVGSWYSCEDFREHFKMANNEHEAWTEISVPVFTPEGEVKVAIQIEQYWASQVLVEAVLQFAEHLRKSGRLWIRVE